MIRILLADDQHLIRGALKALLQTESDLSVVAEASDGIEAIREVTKLTETPQSVDIALIDIDMPRMNGIDAIAQISQRCKCLVVTTFARPGYLKRALAAGASGFLAKDTPPEQLAEAIRRIHNGLRVIDPALAEASLFTADSPLTDREADIARMTLQGAQTSDIAAQLHIAKGTVRNHISSIIAKTDASNRIEAARIALDNGWL
ncbi:response regulator transcription factor [Corynebacterium lactis]|uniref:MerR family transcriptional regulator n=1 Tax=Corynebacterium lactis RW2-5 TaxID=1408189 RepID=A0A0K2H1D4_9CORY|nr:response regulator transcription factor [Corynebacterium lactis]ALA67546.1 MerR family transcriptional regulator [Corynebacterium lactis RW2-5]